MNKIKKYVLFGLIIVVLLALFLGPIMSGRKEPLAEETFPATFSFKENLVTKSDEKMALQINVNHPEIEKLELIYNDSVFETWHTPKGKIQYLLNVSFFGLGIRPLKLYSTLKNGETFVDERMVQVLSDVIPELWIAQIEQSYPHNPNSFTQGLEFDNGQLYEGTGQRGQSMVAQIDLNNGKILKNKLLDATCFGEGITIFGSELFQLTWQEQRCFIYDKETLQLKREMNYVGEGWGLCNDGTSLIMSDGSERLTFRNPKTFEIEKTIAVYTHQGPVTKLNELEYADDLIFANIWMTNKIAVIDPRNGKVLAEIDASRLVREGKGAGDVLNGIAFKDDKAYLTGKNWIKLFRVTFIKPSDS